MNIEKIKKKENRNVDKIRKLRTTKYLTMNDLKKKIHNSQFITNISSIESNGVIHLKTNQFALMYKVSSIDLSLTTEREKNIFYNTLSKLYRLPFTIKAYKIDDKINLNKNKEELQSLIHNSNNENAKSILSNNLNFIERIEQENMTSASSYFFAIICKSEEELEKNKEIFEMACASIVPSLNIELISNIKFLVKIFANLYFSDVNLDQILYYDMVDLLVPSTVREMVSSLKFDDKDIQLLTIKNYPLFIEDHFLDRIINLPNVKAYKKKKNIENQSSLINNLNSSYKAVLADYNSNKNLSDSTEMRSLLDNYRLLIEQITANDEKIKEVDIVLAISGTKEEREEIVKEIKRNADLYQIKVDIPRFLQLSAWQTYDLTDKSLKGYEMYFPTQTLAAGFFFTESYHNDTTGWLVGEDVYGLPIFFDPYSLSKNRINHNISILGTSGAGKSFLLKLMILNEFARNTRIVVFDIENEYSKLCKRCGGEIINLANKSLINPLQVRYVLTDDDDTSILSKHLGFLENFFITIFNDISEKELVVLLDIVEKFYNSRGITNETKLEEYQRMTSKDYPIFSDLYAYILEKQKDNISLEMSSILSSLEVLVKRLVIGQDSNLFNGITTIDLNNNLIVFNLQELFFNSSRRIINTQMLNLLTYLSNVIVDNKNKNELDHEFNKMMMVFDEAHNYIDEDNPTLIKYMDQISRRARKYKLSVVLASQQPSDFTSTNNILRHASAMFNNCQYQIFGMLKDNDVEAVAKLYTNTPLTETQKNFLAKCNQGEFLLNITNKNRIRTKVFATPIQKYFMGEVDEITQEIIDD